MDHPRLILITGITDTPRLGLWLDTSNLGVNETVERILTKLEAARVG
jgi:hypothetical protein